MKRAKDRDEFGGEYEYKMQEMRRCPVCRREVEEKEINYVKNQL